MGVINKTINRQAGRTFAEMSYQFQAVAESAGEGITFCDSSGKFLVYNLKMQELTGYTADEANNSGDFTGLLYPEPVERQKALRRLHEIAEHKAVTPQEAETTIRAKDGTKKILWISTTAMRFKDEEMFLSIYRDITERKKVQEEIQKKIEELERSNQALKQLDSRKNDFVSNVSHELRTPLTTMKEFVSIVLDEIPGKINKEQKHYLNIVQGNIDRLSRLILNLLDISKIEAGKVELKRDSVNLNSLISGLIPHFSKFAQDAGLELKVNAPEKQIDIYADAEKIIQIFVNLISNALKFTQKGSIEISFQEKENEIECSVADTGIGISKNDLPQLFGKFQQFDRVPGDGEKGTGLGLSIVKALVELHQGKIWVESRPGKGSKFCFTLLKYTAEEFFKEHVNNGIKEAMKRNSKMSIIMVSLLDLEKVKREFSDVEIDSILKDIEGVVKSSLRRAEDVSLKGSEEIVVLMDCDKVGALGVEGRLKQALADYLVSNKLDKKIKLHFGLAVYPDDAKSDEGLLKKARNAKNGGNHA